MMETLHEAIERLDDAGFVDDLVAVDGKLRSTTTHLDTDPASFRVAEVVRFEGASDPGDEAIVFALADADGRPVGTYTTPYGPDAGPDETRVIIQLSRLAADRR